MPINLTHNSHLIAIPITKLLKVHSIIHLLYSFRKEVILPGNILTNAYNYYNINARKCLKVQM